MSQTDQETTQDQAKKEPVQQEKHKHSSDKLMLVRYGRMGHLGWFSHHESHIPHSVQYVVIKTDRGLELGELVGSGSYKNGQFRSSVKEVRDYYGVEDRQQPVSTGGTFVRFADSDDLNEVRHLEKSAKDELKLCEKFVKEMKLPMKLIDSEHLLGGERIVIYFSSSGRVDFRELVKKLAREYQTRIELRQVGSRDEAKLISDYETCGQPCCCRQFLKILAPVNMRMAKLQKATLDPSKISGHCGRLKCCLRYEDDTYRDLKKKLPKKNMQVTTPNGPGKVIDMHILTQLVVVQDEQGNRTAWSVDEIEKFDPNNPNRKCQTCPKKKAHQDDISDPDDLEGDLRSEGSVADVKEANRTESQEKTDRRENQSRGRQDTQPQAGGEKSSDGKDGSDGRKRGKRRGRRRGRGKKRSGDGTKNAEGRNNNRPRKKRRSGGNRSKGDNKPSQGDNANNG